MPRHREAMKDVVGCDKPRLAVNRRLNRGFPNWATCCDGLYGVHPRGNAAAHVSEYIGCVSERGELKHLSNPRKEKKTRLPQ